MICKILLLTWITIDTMYSIIKHGQDLPKESRKYDGVTAIISWFLVIFLLLGLF
jgi:hypothetical protein